MRIAVLALVLSAASASWAVEAPSKWHRVVGLLQYLEGDYPTAFATHNADEFAEQRTMAGEVLVTLEQIGPDGEVYKAQAVALGEAIGREDPPAQVTSLARTLAREVIAKQNLVQSPRHTPDLKQAATQFAALCATCHGADGHADGPVAQGLTPKPANFHDAERMQTLTPYKVFNTTTFGLAGTSMVAFTNLSDDERWNLAFFVMSLRQPQCIDPAVKSSLTELATQTDIQLSEKYSDKAVPCLRRVMPKTDDSSLLAVAGKGVDEAVRLSHEGNFAAARQSLIDAYLQGFEPLEPALRARNPDLLARVEKGFADARLAAEAGKLFDSEAEAIKALLESTEASSGPGDFWSVFFAALLILIREGFEATVVVGALLALMKKMDAKEHVRVVHAGWILALVFGALAFIFGHAFFAGANREWLETSVALVAVGMLLYAALWLNARATMSRFMIEMREKMKDALGEGSKFGLFMIAFSSVGRESVETVLFLEGLAGDSRSGALWGAAAGLAILLGLVLLVRRVGYVLPMKAMFTASTIVLVVTAIALLGKGLHGLEELGVLSVHPFPFVTVMPLGLFPDALSLGGQLVLTILVLAYAGVKRMRTTKRAAA